MILVVHQTSWHYYLPVINGQVKLVVEWIRSVNGVLIAACWGIIFQVNYCYPGIVITVANSLVLTLVMASNDLCCEPFLQGCQNGQGIQYGSVWSCISLKHKWVSVPLIPLARCSIVFPSCKLWCHSPVNSADIIQVASKQFIHVLKHSLNWRALLWT